MAWQSAPEHGPGQCRLEGTSFLDTVPAHCARRYQEESAPWRSCVTLSGAWHRFLQRTSWQSGIRKETLGYAEVVMSEMLLWNLLSRSCCLPPFSPLPPELGIWLKMLYSSWGWIILLFSRSDMDATKEVHRTNLVCVSIQQKCVQGRI